MRVAVPRLGLVLPGRWAQVRCDDIVRVEALLQVVEQEAREVADELRRRLSGLVVAGGDQIMWQLGSSPAVGLITLWPHSAPVRSSDDLSHLLAPRLSPCEVVEHDHGFAMVRTALPDAGDRSSAAAYWLAHPGSGRLLCVEILWDGHSPGGPQIDEWDDVMRSARWDDDATDRLDMSGGQR